MKTCGIIVEHNYEKFYEQVEEKLKQNWEMKFTNMCVSQNNFFFYAYMEREKK